ncbi:MAG: outer membrane protein transport protein [Edaphocola sp.]
MKKATLLMVGTSLVASSVWAGSFQLNLQGIRQTAMGGSGVAYPWDASTIFFNPGGLSRLGGMQAYASVHFLTPHVRYVQTPTGDYTADTKTHLSTPFAVYVGGPVKKGSRLGVGVAAYTPFGSSINWGDDWTGRYIIQSISLQSIFIQPTVSYAVNDNISVGAGFVYGFGSVDITKAIPVQDATGADGQAKLKGNAHGMGFNVGIQVKATDDLRFGVSYRSGVTMKVNNGDAAFTVPASVSAQFPATTFKTELPLPGILTVGAAYKATKDLTLQADLVYAGWKKYDSLSFDFEENLAVSDVHDARSYKNTLALRLGAHYQLCEGLSVMAGGAYDPTPTRSNLVSPDAVDANRITLACGLTYNPLPKLTLMGVLNYTTTSKRTVSYDPDNFSGAYQIKSLAPAIGVAYSF